MGGASTGQTIGKEDHVRVYKAKYINRRGRYQISCLHENALKIYAALPRSEDDNPASFNGSIQEH